jgi:starch synthase
MSRILFVTSEAHPLIKTGGLGDVSGSLPAALKSLRHAVRLLLPAYQSVLEKLTSTKVVATLKLPLAPSPVRILEGRMPDTGVILWLVDSPECFRRVGNPYVAPDGRDWSDNGFRFALFARAAVEVAMDRAGLKWRPEAVHCNDWQTGLVPALLSGEPGRPGTVFTIHNLAYQGLFPWHVFADLALPHHLWSMDAMEFHGHFSFIKGGLVFADWLTTVSPTYAREIRTPDYGYGLDGLLNYRSDRLRGILNGADYEVWDPSHDKLIAQTYTARTFEDKAANKKALQARFNLPEDANAPLLGLVGRMVEQKGIDLVLAALPSLLRRGVQVVIVGSGDQRYEQAATQLAARAPRQVGVFIGYCEERAHQVEAGADMFLMPSRFEPCGLNQLYSMRYGTVPVVRRTGGLADTVVDASAEAIQAGTATGFAFGEASAEALTAAVERALRLYGRPEWSFIARTGMAQDFSWEASAKRYLALYTEAAQAATPPK